MKLLTNDKAKEHAREIINNHEKARGSNNVGLLNPLINLPLVTEHQRQDYILGLLLSAYRKNNHCFAKGCSRKTLTKWVYITCGACIHPNELRRVLQVACDSGLMVKSTSVTGHSVFTATRYLALFGDWGQCYE